MVAELTSASFFVGLLRITSIDILLSGDNAVVIALASRSRPGGAAPDGGARREV